MSETQSSYRQIFKSTSLFGGVQVIVIMIGIVKTKFIAIWLGTEGIGILGLLNSPLNLIISISGLGIAFSSIRNISEAHVSSDNKSKERITSVVLKWSLFAGLLGLIVTLALSPLLSKWSFGDQEYTVAFIWLSVVVLLQIQSQGLNAILQGSRRLKELAKSGLFGAVLGLLASLPLYFFLRTKGIVPSIIISAVAAFIISFHLTKNLRRGNDKITIKETYFSGIKMVKLGLLFTGAGVLASLNSYVINALISSKEGIAQVGLYNAAWSITGQYTSLIFSAMATDYFPRLSTIHRDNHKVKELVHQQAETALLIMTPLLVLIIMLMPFVIKLLYTDAFIPVVSLSIILILGMPFKAMEYSMGYVFLSKGEGRLYITMQIIFAIIILTFNIVFYSFMGLNGLGVSFILYYFIFMISSFIMLNRKYDFNLSKKFVFIFLVNLSFVILAFIFNTLDRLPSMVVLSTLILIVSVVYSIKQLDKVIDFRSFFSSLVNRG